LPNIVRTIGSGRGWPEHVARIEEKGAYKGFVIKDEGKELLNLCGFRWECNIKMEPNEIGWEVDWLYLA
jgi:hypothetical protein